jgi:hypothetical protein
MLLTSSYFYLSTNLQATACKSASNDYAEADIYIFLQYRGTQKKIL